MRCRNCGSESISDNICNSCGTEQYMIFNNDNTSKGLINVIKGIILAIFVFAFISFFVFANSVNSMLNLTNETIFELIPEEETTNADWQEKFHNEEYQEILNRYKDMNVNWKNVVYSMANYNFEVTPNEFENIILSNLITINDNENVTESVN